MYHRDGYRDVLLRRRVSLRSRSNLTPRGTAAFAALILVREPTFAAIQDFAYSRYTVSLNLTLSDERTDSINGEYGFYLLYIKCCRVVSCFVSTWSSLAKKIQSQNQDQHITLRI